MGTMRLEWNDRYRSTNPLRARVEKNPPNWFRFQPWGFHVPESSLVMSSNDFSEARSSMSSSEHPGYWRTRMRKYRSINRLNSVQSSGRTVARTPRPWAP